MNLSEIQGFFANLLTALGLKEHPDGFNRQNIPSYMLDRMFSIDIGQIQGQAANHVQHQFTMPITVNISFKDYRSSILLRQAALERTQEIFGLVLTPSVRLKNGIKDIRPTSVTITPLSQSNDNVAVLSIGFDITLIYAF